METAYPLDIETAKSLHRSGLLERAADLYRRHLAAAPADQQANQLLGLAFHQMGNRNVESVRSFARALLIDRSKTLVAENFAVACRILLVETLQQHKNGLTGQALAGYADILRYSIAPDLLENARSNSETLLQNMFQTGRKFLENKDPASAWNIYGLMSRSFSRHPCTIMLHALILWIEGKEEKVRDALIEIGKAGRIADFSKPISIAINVQIQKNNFAGLRRIFLDVITGLPACGQAYYYLAQILRIEGHADEAAVLAKRAALIDTTLPVVQLLAGELAFEAFDIKASARFFLEAIYLQPDYEEAYAKLSGLSPWHLHTASIVKSLSGAASAFKKPNVYVKAFSRPMYLDRCLASIERQLKNYGSIFLLNDGIGEPFISKIKSKYPKIIVLDSPKIKSDIYASPQNERYKGRKKNFKNLDYLDPVRFWHDAIKSDDGDAVFIMEEDAWLIGSADLMELALWMRQRNCIGFGLWQGDQSEETLDRARRFDIFQDSNVELRSIRDTCRASAIKKDWETGYSVFPLAGSLLNKDYFLCAYHDVRHWADEQSLMTNVVRLWALIAGQTDAPFTSASLRNGIVWHTSNSTSRADAGGKSIRTAIDIQHYNDVMNWLWYQGDIDAMHAYPREIPVDFLESRLQLAMKEEDIAKWRDWRRDFLRIFPHLDV